MKYAIQELMGDKNKIFIEFVFSQIQLNYINS